MKKLIGFLFSLLLVLVLCAGIASAAEEAPVADEQITEDESAPVTDGATNGWVKVGYWWFYLKNGVEQTGWQKINDVWYYLFSTADSHSSPDEIENDYGSDGYMVSHVTMWINGSRYAFNSSGAMVTGWYKDYAGNWYYCSSSGAAVKGWNKIGGVWYYFYNESDNHQSSVSSASSVLPLGCSCQMISDQTMWINGSKYAFNSSGAMVTGWYKDDDEWYYFSSSGAMVTGWQKIGGVWYYFSEQVYEYGRMQTGWEDINGSRYYFKSSGAMATGWVKTKPEYSSDDDESAWYYFNSSGAMATGWKKLNGTWYYLSKGMSNSSGKYFRYGEMLTGVNRIDDAYYGFSSSGAMATGWYKDSSTGSWYYFSSSGAAVTGWQQISGTWYYFYSNYPDNGKMAASDVVEDVDGTLRVLDSSGRRVQNGWVQIDDGKAKAYAKNGTAVTGWHQIDGTWYYFYTYGHWGDNYYYSEGTMAVNTVVEFSGEIYDDNGNYHYYNYGPLRVLGSNGKWVQLGWVQTDDGKAYAINGQAVTGMQTIGGKQYCFNSSGIMYQGTRFYYDGSYYYADSSGVVSATT